MVHNYDYIISLTHCGLYKTTQIFVNLGAGNDLKPNGTKPMLETMLLFICMSCSIHWMALFDEKRYQALNMVETSPYNKDI